MKEKKEKIAAVVVTYNRKELLKKCIESLLGQTFPLDLIIIIDNNSSDGTSVFLKENKFLDNSKIEYTRLLRNTGGAGGFYEGVKKGYEKGFDWLWLMDDDVKPDTRCLEVLMTFSSQNIGSKAITPIRLSYRKMEVEDDSSIKYNLKNFFLTDSREISVKSLYKNLNDIPSKIEIQTFSFEGPLINREIIKKIGYPKKDLFIYADDTDYSLKIRYKLKEKIFLLKNAKIFKMLPANKGADGIGWRNYYALRNGAYLYHTYGENFFVKQKPIFIFIGIILKNFLKLNFDFKKFKITLHALIDSRKEILPIRYLPKGKA